MQQVSQDCVCCLCLAQTCSNFLLEYSHEGRLLIWHTLLYCVLLKLTIRFFDQNMVLVGAVATLAREIENDSKFYEGLATRNPDMARSQSAGWAEPNAISDFVNQEADAALEAAEEEAKLNMKGPNASDAATAFVRKSNGKNEVPSAPEHKGGSIADINPDVDGGEFTESEQVAISEMLDAWEEPARPEESEERKITLGAIMQFRQALSFMKRKYPFLPGEEGIDDPEAMLIVDSHILYLPRRLTIAA